MSMHWNFDKPLRTMCNTAANEADKALWEKENLGGITEDNNRLPMPIVLLVALTIITAFAVTFPLWGQRPTAAIYVGYIKAMNLPEVLAIKDDNEAIKKIIQLNAAGPHEAMLDRHPVNMDDLRIMQAGHGSVDGHQGCGFA